MVVGWGMDLDYNDGEVIVCCVALREPGATEPLPATLSVFTNDCLDGEAPGSTYSPSYPPQYHRNKICQKGQHCICSIRD